MSTSADIPALLRFLTQSASIPLSRAMVLVPLLQKAQLASIPAIAAHPLPQLRALLFPDDEKAAKQLHNAAKRVAEGKTPGKRKSDTNEVYDDFAPDNGRKRRRKSPSAGEPTAAEIEAELALPEAQIVDEDVLRSTVLFTNRAPLLLAFAVVLLKYTMPEQPLSSRLSLAQAMVSTGARARAYDLGIDKSKTAEDEGWGKGQPVVKVVGREIKVLRRWGYDASSGQKSKPDEESSHEDIKRSHALDQGETKAEDAPTPRVDQNIVDESSNPPEQPLWGLDLEALKKFNAPPLVNVPSQGTSGLPIARPEAARAYLLKSFATASSDHAVGGEAGKIKPRKIAEEKERNLGLLLATLDKLYQSWASILSADEMDRRAWSWYAAIRPGVEDGVAGWGGKNVVKLSQILDLRRESRAASPSASQN